MKNTLFTGSAVALITPFTETGVDFNKLEDLIEWHIQEQTDAIVVCGTTGEAPTMPIDEHQEVIQFAVKTSAGRIPIIAGTGSNDTHHAIANSQFAESIGVDGLLSVVPYYNKPTQRGLFNHFKAISNAVDLPIILYNVPSRTGTDLLPKTVELLANFDNIVAIKECNFSHVGELINLCPNDFSVYSGEDGNYLPLLALGGKGVISVMANIIPKDTHLIYEAFVNGDIATSRALQLKTLPLIQSLFVESNPAPTKAAMNLLGMNVGKCRLPLVELEPSHLIDLERRLKLYGLI